MRFFYWIHRHTSIYQMFTVLLAVLLGVLAGSQASNKIDEEREIPLTHAMQVYTSALESGTVNSRAMGAAILLGLENPAVKQLALGRHGKPEVLSVLKILRSQYFSDLAFLVDQHGIVAAYSSQDNTPVAGLDLSLRPYVQLSMQGIPNVYPTVGAQPSERGIFLATPVYAGLDNSSQRIGAIVLKINATNLDALLNSWTGGGAILLSPLGIVFASSRTEWLLHSTGKIGTQKLEQLRLNRQFGSMFDTAQPLALPFALNAAETSIGDQHYRIRKQALEWDDPAGEWTLMLLDRHKPWWTLWSVLGVAAISGILTLLMLLWLYTLARNAVQAAALIQRNQVLMDNALEGIHILDEQGNLLEANDSFCRMLGYTKAELRHLNVADWEAKMTPEELKAALLKLLNGQAVYETLHRCRNALVTDVEVSAIGVKLEGRTCIYCTSRSITERKLSEAATAAATRAKDNFLATMSHELRTPLNGILGMAQILAQPLVFDADRLSYARIILRSGNNLLTLLNDILDISKIVAGKIDLESIAFTPALLMAEVQSLYAEISTSKALELQLSSQLSSGQQYLGDPHRLRQMLNNLVSNAIKFTNEGRVLIEGREISRDQEAAVLEFAVKDTGLGIPQDKLATLFKPFSQVDSSITRQFGGSGLGLSIVQSFARQMGGEAGVSIEPGVGSRFWFTFKTTLTDSVIAPQLECAAAHTKDLSGRVLLVDDSETNRIVIETMLRHTNIVLTLARNGLEAVNIITQGAAVDLILMDVQMPVMNGQEATRKIRLWETEGNHPRLPIIALTADAYAEDRQHCLEAGMDDFMTKPVYIDTLMETLARWLPAVSECPVAASAERTLFDEKSVLTKMANDSALALTVVVASKREMTTCFDKLLQAVESNDRESIVRQVHTLKAVAAQAGGTQLAQLLQELDKNLNAGGNLDKALLSDLQQKHRLLDAQLQEWITAQDAAVIEPISATLAAPIYRQLEILLLESRFDAIPQFRMLQGAILRTEVAAELSRIAPLLDELNFEATLEHLRPIAFAEGWKE
jgi:PAS domain S-box-containing protein